MTDDIHIFLKNLFEESNLHRTHPKVNYVQLELALSDHNNDFNNLLSGKRTAVFRLKQWFVAQKMQPPDIDNILIFTDFYGEPRAAVKVTKVETVIYKEFTKELAMASGVEAGCVDTWKSSRKPHIVADCERIDMTFSEDIEIVAIWLKLLHPLDAAARA